MVATVQPKRPVGNLIRTKKIILAVGIRPVQSHETVIARKGIQYEVVELRHNLANMPDNSFVVRTIAVRLLQHLEEGREVAPIAAQVGHIINVHPPFLAMTVSCD